MSGDGGEAGEGSGDAVSGGRCCPAMVVTLGKEESESAIWRIEESEETRVEGEGER